MPTLLNSADGLLAMLEERDDAVQTVALRHLLRVCDQFWPELFERIDRIEELYEDTKFAGRHTAALLASKVYFQLGEMRDSMQFALGAADQFDVSERSEYTSTIVARCIDEYVAQRLAAQAAAANAGAKNVDARLETIVNNMFARCFENKEERLALGIALEARRLDVVRQALSGAADQHGILRHCLDDCVPLLDSLSWREEVLRTLLDMYAQLKKPDYVSMCVCLIRLDDRNGTVTLLRKLVDEGGADDRLLAYQLAFLLVDNATQAFTDEVVHLLPKPDEAAAPVGGGSGDGTAAPMDTTADAASATTTTTTTTTAAESTTASSASALKQLRHILSGRPTAELYARFLERNCHTDMLLLRNMKQATDARNSVLHGGIVFANAMMNAGTKRDAFLRRNRDWVKRVANWAKFSAVAATGVIHQSNFEKGLSQIEDVLPRGGGTSSPYAHGGALFALGLMYANQGSTQVTYLLDELNAANGQPIVQHGACLGLGVAAMGSARRDVYDAMQAVLYTLSAVAGEAAGIGMGLCMLGSGDGEACEQLLAYAHDTEHEKIIRGIAMGLALIMYAREEEADTLIEQLERDKDPLLRYGGMYTIALAYAGTANNKAIARLLHVAVSDASDDVRRAAVTALGFVLCRHRQQCPRVVSLLSQSYNPHVRYGAAMALAVACACTGDEAALRLLEPLRTDTVDFVRQGALIASSMILCQRSVTQNKLAGELRAKFTEILGDKHEPLMSKLGAAYAGGILEAGGRNVAIALHSSSSSQLRANGVVGVALFLQHWSWYPFSYFLPLAFQPTCIVGVNERLDIVRFSFTSHSRPALYTYPEPTKVVEKKKGEKVATAVLSTTAAAPPTPASKRAKLTASNVAPEDTSMLKASTQDLVAAEAEALEAQRLKEEAEAMAAKEAAERARLDAASEVLESPARVTREQLRNVRFDVDARFVPVVGAAAAVGGVLLLRDNKPDDTVPLASMEPQLSDKVVEPDEPEAPCPPPFTFDASKEDESD